MRTSLTQAVRRQRAEALLTLALALAAAPRSLRAQVDRTPESQAGPRVGFTVIVGQMADTLRRRYDVRPVVTQFGWQFETRMFRVDDRLTGMTELVALVGGLEQGVFLPSVSWMVGLRSHSGVEAGIGPNVSAAGVALAAAGGLTIPWNGINFPVTLAVASGRGGQRYSVLAGFTLRD